MYQELFPHLSEIKNNKSESGGRKESFYLYLTLDDLNQIKTNGFKSIIGKIPYSYGCLKENDDKKMIFSAQNISLEQLFHQFEDKTTVKDLNKSWDSSKKWFYRSIFPLLDFRKEQIKKLNMDIKSTDSVLKHKSNIHNDYIEKRKTSFLENFKKVMDELEVFEQFDISAVQYYSKERLDLLLELNKLYFNENFLREIQLLMEYIKETYKKKDLVIYLDFNDINITREIYEFEHSLFVMFSGFLKKDSLKVKKENGKNVIYGFVPLLSFDNDNKKTFKQYGRNEETNFLVSAAKMMELYRSGIFDRYYYSQIFKHHPKIKELEIKKKIIISNGDTTLAEQIIRNDISDKLPVPNLPFEVKNNVNYQKKNELFGEVRRSLFNNPKVFYNNFYYKVLDSEAISNLKIETGKVTNTIKEAIISTHPNFKSFFDGNAKAIRPLFPNKILRIFEERVARTNNDEKWKQRDIKELINLISYLKQIIFNEVTALSETREKINGIIAGETDELNSKEFYYAIGQICKFYGSKSKSKEKRFSLYDPLTGAKNTTRLIDELLKMKEMYHHSLGTNDIKHSRLLSAILIKYDQMKDIKLGLDEKVYFNSGLVDQSVFYTKKEEENENESEENTNDED